MREHAEWKEIRRSFGKYVFKNYFKFCFERNPWAKAVSYYWERGFDRRFDIWCMDGYDSKAENSQYYMEGNNLRVDFVGKVENLKNDVKYVMNKLGLRGDVNLPQYRGGYKNRKIHYSYYYDDITKDRIRNLFRKQIKLFGYTFENGEHPKDKIIINTLYSISGYILAVIVKKITSLLINQDEPEIGYLNILYSQNPAELQEKYPDYKIISLVPNLIQDYYDTISNHMKKEQLDIDNIRLPEITPLHEISEADNTLYIDSYHVQRNPKSIFYKISEFLNIPIINIDELSDFYKTNNENMRDVFIRFLMFREPILHDELSPENTLKIYHNIKPKIMAYT